MLSRVDVLDCLLCCVDVCVMSDCCTVLTEGVAMTALLDNVICSMLCWSGSCFIDYYVVLHDTVTRADYFFALTFPVVL